jgi:hypothetical protein
MGVLRLPCFERALLSMKLVKSYSGPVETVVGNDVIIIFLMY